MVALACVKVLGSQVESLSSGQHSTMLHFHLWTGVPSGAQTTVWGSISPARSSKIKIGGQGSSEELFESCCKRSWPPAQNLRTKFPSWFIGRRWLDPVPDRNTVVSKLIPRETMWFESVRRGVLDYASNFLPQIIVLELVVWGGAILHHARLHGWKGFWG